MRGGPARLVTGNPLGGMFRELNRQARRPTRRRAGAPQPVVEGGQEAVRPPVTPAPALLSGPVGVVAETGEDGRARWVFPAPYAAPPVLTVAVVDPDPADEERTVTAAVEEVTARGAVVRVWRTRSRRGAGVAEPAGPGVLVHLGAFVAAERGAR